MTAARVKYPRTSRLPASPGVGSDEKIIADLSAFDGAEVVVTEKIEGENTTLYAGGADARAHETGYLPSRDWLAAVQAQIGRLIPKGWRICGENLYTRHSGGYDALKSYFLGFSAWDQTNTCLSRDDTQTAFDRLDVTPAPTLYRGPFSPDLPNQIAADLNADTTEGFVTRLVRAFPFDAFATPLLKWVYASHVQSDTHWRGAPLTPNGLEGST